MKIDLSFIASERETADLLLSQLVKAAAPVRFRVKQTARDGREHIYLSVSEDCPVKPYCLTEG